MPGSFGTLHSEVTLIEWEEEWRGEWHVPSRCCTTVTQMGTHAHECTWTMHTLFKYTCVSLHTYTIYWCMYAYLRAHTPFLQYTNFYIFATTHLQCSSNPRDSQEPLISISNVFVSILPAYISSVYYFRLIRKLCLACFGAYGNCMCCVSVSGAQNTKKKEKKLYIKHFTCIHLECSLLYFHFSGFFFFYAYSGFSLKKGVKWASSTRPLGAGENQHSHNRPNSSTAWMDSVCSLWTESLWESYFLDPAGCPITLSDHLRRSSAQPNPVQLLFPFSFSCADIFILLLKLLRAHYLRGRNVALIVWWLQCLGPFFSVCNLPTLASCSERYDSSSTWTMSPLFRAPSTQSRL